MSSDQVKRRVIAAVQDVEGGIAVFCNDGSVWLSCWNVNGGIKKWLETLPIPGTDRAIQRQGDVRCDACELDDALAQPICGACENPWTLGHTCGQSQGI